MSPAIYFAVNNFDETQIIINKSADVWMNAEGTISLSLSRQYPGRKKEEETEAGAC